MIFRVLMEKSLICRENNVSKQLYEKATRDPFSFIYIDKPKKQVKKNFDEKI